MGTPEVGDGSAGWRHHRVPRSPGQEYACGAYYTLRSTTETLPAAADRSVHKDTDAEAEIAEKDIDAKAVAEQADRKVKDAKAEAMKAAEALAETSMHQDTDAEDKAAKMWLRLRYMQALAETEKAEIARERGKFEAEEAECK